MKRGRLMIGVIVMVALTQLALRAGVGQAADEKSKGDGKIFQALFVQTAKGVTFDGTKMTLKGVSATTLFFADRPDRIAGHLTTTRYLAFWTEGKDSFDKDPPNADLSVFGNDGKATEVVVVLRNPQFKGEDLTYDVRVVEGTIPTINGPCSLFIDIIGMPLTPMSYAGVARRSFRRAVY